MAIIRDFLNVLLDTDHKLAKLMLEAWISRRSTTESPGRWTAYIETPVTNEWIRKFREHTHKGLQKGVDAYRRSGNCDDEGDRKMVMDVSGFMEEFDRKAETFLVVIPPPPPAPPPPPKVDIPADCFPEIAAIERKLQKTKKLPPQPLPPITKHALVIVDAPGDQESLCSVLKQLGYRTPPNTYKVTDTIDNSLPEEIKELMSARTLDTVVMAGDVMFQRAKRVFELLQASGLFREERLATSGKAYQAWTLR